MRIRDFKGVVKSWKKFLNENMDGAPEGTPKIQGVHPLIDGLYPSNGVTPDTLKQAPSAVGIMESNPENEHFKLAMAIMNNQVEGVPFFPFGFEDALLEELSKAGLPQEEVQTLQYEFGSRDNEYQVPYTDW